APPFPSRLIRWSSQCAGNVIPTGQSSTKRSHHLAGRGTIFGRRSWGLRGAGDRRGINRSCSGDELSEAFAAVSASLVTRDQQEQVPARVMIVATGRQSPAHDFSSIIDIESFR